MRAVIQKVSDASVNIEGRIKASIGIGLLVLVGFEEADTVEDLEWTAKKIVQMRLFNDDDGVMNRSLKEVHGELLIVSQFTLFASTKKGNRPSYIKAAKPEIAIPLYEQFLKMAAEQLERPVESGTFGADMKVTLVNDGPVTILIDSKNRE
ncbi:MAG: D-aminoacyl-tRNA deacylase [Chitinophagales bacterium]|nr:D-aminoacyl-tRNA deacylase [Chitinophagales bacterium]